MPLGNVQTTAPLPSIAFGDPSIILWLFFFIGLAITVWFGFGLIYHWIRYGSMYPLALAMLPVYVTGALVFIGAMLAAIAMV